MSERNSGQWQPIETAPRDGTRILIHGGEQLDGGDIYTGIPSAKKYAVAWWEAKEEGWRFATYEDGYWGQWSGATHWMPLPEPPKEAK